MKLVLKKLRRSAFLVVFVPSMAFSQNWTQMGSDIDGLVVGDRCGTAVALSADGLSMVVSSPDNNLVLSQAGEVRVFEWDGLAWVQKGSNIYGEASGDISGQSLAMSDDGNTIAIGARLNDGNGPDAGHVRIYEWDGSSWSQKGLDIDGEAAGDFSGHSLSMSADGNRVAIGAIHNDGNGSSAGHVRVYQWDGMLWSQMGADLDGLSSTDFFGESVSISADGNVVVAGGPVDFDGSFSGPGYVNIYAWDGSSWNQRGSTLTGVAAADNFGHSVSSNSTGNIVAISAPEHDGNGSNSGQVSMFEWDGSAWQQLGLPIDGEAADDESGAVVSINDAGDVVAISSSLNDDNGSNAGHVRIYEWDGTAWNQVGQDIDGESTEDRSGVALQLNADGTTVVVGAPLNDANSANNAGHVRAFQFQNCNTMSTDVQSACNSYTWIDGITYTSSNDTASYTLQNAAGCDSIVTLDLTINTVNVSTSNSGFTISADAQGATYQWIDCDNNNAPISGETGQSFTATSNGNYAVIVTENSCSDTSACVAVTTIGIADAAEGLEFSMYPNPTEGNVHLVFNEVNRNVSVEVRDVQGRLLSVQRFSNASQANISLEEAPGVYFLTIRSGSKHTTTKIVKR